MKKAIILPLLLCLLFSCLRNPEYQSYNLDGNFVFPEEVPVEYRANAPVKLNNLQKNYTLNTKTDSLGNVIFIGVEPGFYSLQLRITSYNVCYTKLLRLMLKHSHSMSEGTPFGKRASIVSTSL